MWTDLPKHPLEREMKCPICGKKFKTIPLRRGRNVNDHQHLIEQHACPNGHVFQTEIDKDEMLP